MAARIRVRGIDTRDVNVHPQSKLHKEQAGHYTFAILAEGKADNVGE